MGSNICPFVNFVVDSGLIVDGHNLTVMNKAGGPVMVNADIPRIFIVNS